MTRFATPTVNTCPDCTAFFLQSRFRSVNFFGVQVWSDGKPTMWWRQQSLVRCNACAALFWRKDAESVGIMPETPGAIGPLTRIWLRWRGNAERQLQSQDDWSQAIRCWGNAQRIGSVSFDDVVYVLARSKGVSRDRVLWLRNRIWWGLNDRYRSLSDGWPLHDVPSWQLRLSEQTWR